VKFSEFIEKDFSQMPVAEAYGVMASCIAPRPIAFVSTLSPDGKPNLAPFSYFMAGGSNPPSLAFSPTPDRTGQPKDTLRNIEETGEFVVHIVTYEMREKMNITSSEFPYGVSEWEHSGFTPVLSTHVKPPRAAESPIALECKLFKIIEHGEGFASARYVIGEILTAHIAQEVMTDGEIDTEKVDYLARLGGNYYARAHSEALFELARPPKVQKYPEG